LSDLRAADGSPVTISAAFAAARSSATRDLYPATFSAALIALIDSSVLDSCSVRNVNRWSAGSPAASPPQQAGSPHVRHAPEQPLRQRHSTKD
jgi:hypothetical protein